MWGVVNVANLPVKIREFLHQFQVVIANNDDDHIALCGV